MLNIASIVSRLKVPLPPVSSRAAFTHTSLHSARRQAVEAPEGEEILDYDRLEVAFLRSPNQYFWFCTKPG